jgi:hypothetical protein
MEYPHHAVGEVVLADVRNPYENHGCGGKPRPGTLVARSRSGWLLMGHTSKRKYRDGTPRTPIPNPRAVGLNAPGFCWADHLTYVPSSDIHDHIGWVDRELADTIIDLTGINGAWAADLVAAATQNGEDA